MLPDFVVIGAPRSGTTWLHKQLSFHPDVFLSEIKEPRFFAVPGEDKPVFTGPGDDVWSTGMVVRRADYEQLFAAAGDRVKGEASTDYLYRGAVAAPKLRALVPSVRIVAILRDPVVRAHSAWRLLTHSGHETLGFDEALAAEPQRIADGWAWWWHFSQHGFYARNLAPYYETFPSDQILVLAYDDLVAAPQAFLDEVTAFLGLSPLQGTGLEVRINEAPLTRGARQSVRDSPVGALVRAVPAPVLRKARALVDRFTLYKPSVSDASQSSLSALYEQDLDRLQELTGRRFTLEL